jgi:PAS domain S-box-containing protein
MYFNSNPTARPLIANPKPTRLSECIDFVEPVAPETESRILIDRFSQSPDLMVVPVIGDLGTIEGLIDRDRLTLAMSAKFGHALYAHKPIRKIMDANPVVIEGTANLETLIKDMINNRLSDMLRGFIVIEDGLYSGIGTGLNLLRHLSYDLRAALDAQTGLTQHILMLNQETQRQKAFLDTVIEHLPAMVMVKNVKDSRISLLNQNGANLLGIDAKAAIGKSSSDLFDEDFSTRIHDYEMLALKSAHPIVFEETIENVIDQKMRTLQLKKTALYDSHGQAETIITVGVDLTEQKEA